MSNKLCGVRTALDMAVKQVFTTVQLNDYIVIKKRIQLS